MSKKSFYLLFSTLFVVGLVTASVLYFQFKGSAVKADSEVFISSRFDYARTCDSILPRIGHHWAFRRYAEHLELERSFKPGHYVLKKGMSVIEVVRMLKLGIQTPVTVTINYAKIPQHLARKLSRQLDADSAAFMRVLTSDSLARTVGFDSLTLFSMFLPDNYEFYWTVTPESFLRRMKREYDNFWNEKRERLREKTGMSRLEVMTLASIVFEETRAVDEMPRVAGVYMNRLKRNIRLQADPTVKYALQDFSLRRILYKHLKFKSPYNTYINTGLPPTPIAMPSKQAIDAVLNYEHHDYIFFCARPEFDGHHNFARTYAEHKRNAKLYAAELNRRKIK